MGRMEEREMGGREGGSRTAELEIMVGLVQALFASYISKNIGYRSHSCY